MGNEELFPTETSNDCENQNVCEKLYDIVIIIDCYHMWRDDNSLEDDIP